MDREQHMMNIELFVQVCDTLSSNPKYATQILTEYRESDGALEGCKSFLQQPNISLNSFFQAALVLQYAFLKHWNRILPEFKQELESVIYSLLIQHSQQDTSVSFAVVKAMQVYALLWKHSWPDINTSQRMIFFDKISCFLQQSSPPVLVHGSVLLRIVIEEFCNRGNSQLGLPMTVHNTIRLSFENEGLDNTFGIAIGSYRRALDGMSKLLQSQMNEEDLVALLTALSVLKEATKTVNEVLCWEFYDPNNQLRATGRLSSSERGGEEDCISRQSLTLPAQWTEQFLRSSLLRDVSESYTTMKRASLVLQKQQSLKTRPKLTVIQHCFSQTRLLLNNICALHGKFQHEEQDKTLLGNHICDSCLQLLPAAFQSYSTVGEDWLEAQQFASLLLNFLDNFRLVGLCHLREMAAVIQLLGQVTRALAVDLTSQFQVVLAGTRDQLMDGDGDILDSWRGDSLTVLLEAWRVLLDDPLMATHYLTSSPLNSIAQAGQHNNERNVVLSLKWSLVELVPPLFTELFSIVQLSARYEVVRTHGEAEEDGDAEDISKRSLHDLISSICALGRASFRNTFNSALMSYDSSLETCQKLLLQSFDCENIHGISLNSLSGTTNINPAIANDSHYKLKCTLALEEVRIAILFLGHLLADDYCADEDLKPSSETPLVPVFVFDAVLVAPDVAEGVLNGVRRVCALLSLQANLLSIQRTQSTGGFARGRAVPLPGRSHPLFSPLLMQLSLELLSQYLCRYILVDTRVYDETLKMAIAQLNLTHLDPRFDELIGLTAAVVRAVVVWAPQETAVVSSAASLLARTAEALSQKRLKTVTQLPNMNAALFATLPDISNLYSALTASDSNGLTHESTTALYNSLAVLVVSAGSSELCSQICASLYNQFQLLHSSLQNISQQRNNSNHLEMKTQILSGRAFAGLRGLCKYPFGELDIVTHPLIQTCLPVAPLFMRCFDACDDLSLECLLLLRDTAEVQLPTMTSGGSLVLYTATIEVLRLLSKRLLSTTSIRSSDNNGQVSIREEISDGFEQDFRSDALLHCLELLNHLVTKDLQLDDTSNSGQNGNSHRSFVPEVLLTGLEIVLPLITPQLLQSFPRTTDRYFSYLSLLLSSYGDELAAKVVTLQASGGALLSTLIQQLLWAAGAVDSVSARLALQALQWLSAHQYTSMQRGGAGFGVPVSMDLFAMALVRLVELLVQPRQGEYGITMDRLEAFANTVATLIALDFNRFKGDCQVIISRQPLPLQEPLADCFEKFLSARLNFEDITKPSRIQFVRKFREFVLQLRSIVVFA